MTASEEKPMVTAKEQRMTIKNLGMKQIIVNETWYPIVKIWYESWVKYTMFDKSDKNIPGGIDNLEQVNGPKPGEIDNSALQGI